MSRISKLAALTAMAAMMATSEKRKYVDTGVKSAGSTRLSDDEFNALRGLKKFKYGDNVIYALNQKSADKKACKKGWL